MIKSEDVKDIIILLLLMVLLTLLPGCSSFEIITDQDKIDAVVIPDNVTVTYFDTRYEYQKYTGMRWCGNSVWESVGGKCDIYLVKRYEVLIHELSHCSDGEWHKGYKVYNEC